MWSNDQEILFISGIFLEDFEMPKEYRFLWHYFKTSLEVQFVRYYYCFGTVSKFTDNTGFVSSRTTLWRMEKMLLKLLDEHGKARQDFDINKIVEIETSVKNELSEKAIRESEFELF